MEQRTELSLSGRAAWIIAELVAAGLRDRGPENPVTGRRLEAFGALEGGAKRIVCDCVDAEPGTGILSYVLATRASLVVEGALAAAAATRAAQVEFRIGEADEAGAEAVARALAETTPGGNDAELGADRPEVLVVRAPFRQDLKGYEAVPTLVVDAETLSCIGAVLRDGAAALRAAREAVAGRQDVAPLPGDPSIKIFQVSGAVRTPGVFELPLGTTLRELLSHCGGIEDDKTLLAVIVGGAKGACHTEEELDLPLDFDAVRESGGSLGSGAVTVLTTDDCIVDEVRRRISRSCYDECGKCSLGREGSYQLREIVTDMTRGKSRGSDPEMIREIARGMKEGCACILGRLAPDIVTSATDKFPAEFEAHMKRRLCRALVCDRYVTYHILPDLCDGCGECAEECPEEAIEGGRRKIHVIDQDMCEKCGRCYEVCAGLKQAVVKAGAVKPRTPKKPIPVGSWGG